MYISNHPGLFLLFFPCFFLHPPPFFGGGGVGGHLVTEKIEIIIDSEFELWEYLLALNTWNCRIKVVIPNNNNIEI